MHFSFTDDSLILGIETTCDETACAVVRGGQEILSNVVSSQIDLHAAFGGVVPELACRRHLDLLVPVMRKAVEEAGCELSKLGGIAVAAGPGLVGALLIGVNAAKALSLALTKPLIGVNHVEGHLYAALMGRLSAITFPCLGVVVSGGHTAILEIQALGSYKLIGQTVDDAIGEAFDKVAKILGLPYPGGPVVEQLAKQGNPTKFPFRSGRIKGRPLDLSFSGLKTAVLYAVKGPGNRPSAPDIITESQRADVAASFQEAALGSIVNQVIHAKQRTGITQVVFGGGVTNNCRLRELFSQQASQLECFWPPQAMVLDNAAMIAGLGYHKLLQKPEGDSLALDAYPTMVW